MTKVRSISLRHWKARRPVFALYLAVLVLCVLTIMSFDVFGYFLGPFEGIIWLAAACLLLGLPLILSLRLRDAGQSPYWPLLPLVGILMLLAKFVSSFASIGGAPGSTDPSSGEKVQEAFSLFCLLVLALMSIYAAFAPTKVFPSQ